MARHRRFTPQRKSVKLSWRMRPSAHVAWHFLKATWASLCPSLACRSLVNGTFLEIKDRMFSHLPSLQLL